MSDTYVYKLLAANDWAAAQATGTTATALDIGDGYVHLSTAAQVGETARLHYAGKAGTVLLRFRIDALAALKWEESRGGQLFPHLYGPLQIASADAQWVLRLNDDGVPALPDNLIPKG